MRRASIDQYERAGIPAVWMTTGGARPDSLIIFAAAAGRTQQITLGTPIVPTFPRHRPAMQAMGIPFQSPLAHLREYVRIVKGLLQHQQGRIDFEGTYYQAHETLPEPLEVPVMASALQRRSFERCGAEADGAISWICPGPYLREVALPAMREGAAQTGSLVPPLIAHAPVCVHEHAAEVRAAVRQQVGNPRLPFYQRMLIAAGFPEAAEGTWRDAMIDAIICWGEETRVAERIRDLFTCGATEVLLEPIGAGEDDAASIHRTTRLVAELARSPGLSCMPGFGAREHGCRARVCRALSRALPLTLPPLYGAMAPPHPVSPGREASDQRRDL